MVAARYAPFVGGIETHVREVSRRLAAAGDDIRVVTTDPTGDLPREEVLDGVRVHRVKAWPSQGDLFFAPGITSFIQRTPNTVVHCQGYHTFVAPLAMATAATRNVPYVVTFHSGGHSSRLRHAIRPIQTAALRPLLGRARRLIAVSEFERDLFQRRLRPRAGQLVVVPNGVDLPETDMVSGTIPREELVVSIGRLERYKGHQRVIEALPLVAQRIPGIRLRIAGSGPFESELHRSAREVGVADRVEIAAIPGDDRRAMAALLARAGLVTLLSDYESQGIGAMEALAAGAPVLATSGSALGDERSGGIATVPRTASAHRIADAIIETLRRPTTVDLTRLPTWDATAEALRWIYLDVLANRGDR
jgi:glycosyltransferase involved in cell wall biosynthesis